MVRVAFINETKIRNLDDDNYEDLVDGEIKRVSRGFGDEGVQRK